MFYLFIKSEMQEMYLYQNSSKNLINDINTSFEKNRKFVLESETGIADISYFKHKKSSLDAKYILNNENRRITRMIFKKTEAIDTKNFNTASGANTIHFYDADEIRTVELALGYSIITIHDSYLIDFANCKKLIKIKLEHYRNSLPGYKIENIFILL